MIASPNELRYFVELSKTLNFSRASERIGISQPSLSTAIQRLEYTLGATLFIRDKHKVTLTQAGKNLLSHARQLLQLWNTTKSNCLASQHEVQGDIVLGCHSSIALYFLEKFLPNLMREYPKLEIKLQHDLSRKITEGVINFIIDIGIVVNPIKHPNLIIKKLFDDKIACWQSHDLPAKSSFSDEAIIICDPELIQTQWLLKQIHQKGIKYKRIITSGNLEVIANLTAQGVGVGILPMCVAMSRYPGKIHRIPSSPIYQDEVCLVYRHEHRDIKAIQVTIDAIKLVGKIT